MFFHPPERERRSRQRSTAAQSEGGEKAIKGQTTVVAPRSSRDRDSAPAWETSRVTRMVLPVSGLSAGTIYSNSVRAISSRISWPPARRISSARSLPSDAASSGAP